MTRKYKFHDPDELYFIGFAVVNWIDVFIRDEYREILLQSWKYCMKYKGLEIYAWCIMTSHVHMIIGSHDQPMANIIRDMKKFTSSKLINAIMENKRESRREWMLEMFRKAGERNSQNKNYQFWQQSNQPIELTTPKIIHQKLDYIHTNPVDAGFADFPEAYSYSSAKNYEGQKGLLDIELLDPILSDGLN